MKRRDAQSRLFFAPAPMSDSGIYFLLLRLDRPVRLHIARRSVLFPAAFYIYIGSAQRCLRHRLARHCAPVTRCHWHIDHLRAHARVVAIRVMPGAPREAEAAAAEQWLRHADFMPMPKFGATDSPAPAHLAGFRTRRSACATPMWQGAQEWPDIPTASL